MTYMIELMIKPERLFRFAHEQGIDYRRDADLGYSLHAWLTALLGEQAPKPFRLLKKRGQFRLLGYSSYSGEELYQQAQIQASPLVAAVTDIQDLKLAKAMPQQWNQRRLQFEVLTCPVSRRGKTEKDIYLYHIERHHHSSREPVYLNWIKKQLLIASQPEQIYLSQFKLTNLYRRQSPHKMRRPQALFKGIIRVHDSEQFNQLIARGLGRHRAFGYGMILLRPA